MQQSSYLRRGRRSRTQRECASRSRALGLPSAERAVLTYSRLHAGLPAASGDAHGKAAPEHVFAARRAGGTELFYLSLKFTNGLWVMADSPSARATRLADLSIRTRVVDGPGRARTIEAFSRMRSAAGRGRGRGWRARAMASRAANTMVRLKTTGAATPAGSEGLHETSWDALKCTCDETRPDAARSRRAGRVRRRPWGQRGGGEGPREQRVPRWGRRQCTTAQLMSMEVDEPAVPDTLSSRLSASSYTSWPSRCDGGLHLEHGSIHQPVRLSSRRCPSPHST